LENRKLLLGIDFNNLMFSSFYSEELINSRGQNVNAVRGFFFRLAKYINYLYPDYVVVANDLGRQHTFRRKLFMEYKGNRGELPGNLREQLHFAEVLLTNCGLPLLNNPEYEADDILGMLSRYGTEHNMDTVIVSADRDYYQLISPTVSVLNSRKGEIMDVDSIHHKYGLEPIQLIEVKALAGDTSDNIPGARGIGEKTAVKLVRKFGSVDGIYQNLDKLSPRLQTILRESEEMVRLSHTLGTIQTDYNLIGINDQTIEFRDSRNPMDVFRTIAELEIPSLFNIFRLTILPLTGKKPVAQINERGSD
jgi:DNA polymerase-1